MKIRKYETWEKNELAKEIADGITAKAARLEQTIPFTLKKVLIDYAWLNQSRKDTEKHLFESGILKTEEEIQEYDQMYENVDKAVPILQDMFEDNAVYRSDAEYNFEKKEIPMHFATEEEYKAWDSKKRHELRSIYEFAFGKGFSYYDDIIDRTFTNSEIGEFYWKQIHDIDCTRPIYPPEELARLAERDRLAEERLKIMWEEMCSNIDDEENDDEE